MKVRKLCDFLDSIIPPSNALSYDNVGLLVGSYDTEVTSAIIALDATLEVVKEAIRRGANLIITHHPIIFGGVNRITDEEEPALSLAIRNGISIFAVHTNLDVDLERSNKKLALLLGATDDSIYSTDDISCGALFEILPRRNDEYMSFVKDALGTTGIIANKISSREYQRVFVQGGSFDEDSIPALINNNVELIISGEIKHHIMLKLEALGIDSFVCGHYYTERVFLPGLYEELTQAFPEVAFVLL